MLNGQAKRDHALEQYARWSAILLYIAAFFDTWVDSFSLGWIWRAAMLLGIVQLLGYIPLLHARVRHRISDTLVVMVGVLLIACSMLVLLAAGFHALKLVG